MPTDSQINLYPSVRTSVPSSALPQTISEIPLQENLQCSRPISSDEISKEGRDVSRQANAIFYALLGIRKSNRQGELSPRTLKVLERTEELKVLDTKSEDNTLEIRLPAFDRQEEEKETNKMDSKTSSIRTAIGLFGSLLKVGLKEMFYGSKKPPIHNIVNNAQKFLGIKDEDMPGIVVNGPEAYKIRATAAYIPREDKLCIITDGKIILKTLVGVVSQSLSRLVDLLPEGFGKSISSLLHQKEDYLANITAHELTHSRQFSKVKKLTKDEALKVIKDYISNLDGVRKELLKERIGTRDPFEFLKNIVNKCPEQRKSNILERELQEARETLVNLLDAFIYSIAMSTRKHPEAMRRYTSNVCETEARLCGAAFVANKHLEEITDGKCKTVKDLNSCLKQIREFLLEERKLDDTLLRVEFLKAYDPSNTEIAVLERELNDEARLASPTMVKVFLSQEKFARGLQEWQVPRILDK